MSRKIELSSRLVAVALVAALLSPAFAGTAAAHESGSTIPTEEAFVVEVTQGGDAHVTTTITFDLSEDSEQRAYQQLKQNETKQQHILDRFTTRLRTVAENVENQTGREMTVKPTQVTFQTAENGTVGIAVVTATWTNLAAQQNGNLVVEEPFASGFELSDRQFVLHAPDGYTLAEVTPTPDEKRNGTAVWKEDTDLSGFHAVMQPSETATTKTTGKTPGFGVGAALVCLVGAVLLARRRE